MIRWGIALAFANAVAALMDCGFGCGLQCACARHFALGPHAFGVETVFDHVPSRLSLSRMPFNLQSTIET